VLVVGGGPAGLAAAIAARRKGFSVAVVDAAVPPIDKACGEGLMPDALKALAELGVEIPAGVGLPFRGIRFLGEDVSVEADFPAGSGLAMRRAALHQILVDAAAQAGTAADTYSASNPHKRIDGIFVDSAIDVLECRSVDDVPGVREGSDHLPVLAVLRLP